VIFLRQFLLVNTIRAIVDHRPVRIWNLQWSSAAKNPAAAERPPARWNPRVTTQRRATRGSPAPHSGAADDEAHGRPYRVARAEGLSAQRTRRIIAEMLAIDPPAGVFVPSQIARISESEDRRAHDDEGG
jgi:hypothetical protein